MMRNLIALGCTVALAIGLSIAGIAGSVPDTDSDGVLDPNDNCVTTANGPLAQTGLCDSQEDSNADGYGSPCDTDVNDYCATCLYDVAATLGASVVVSTDPVFDYNCDGAAGLDDVAQALADSVVVAQPGPSGKACASITGPPATNGTCP